MGWLSPCPTASEAGHPRAGALRQEKPLQWEATKSSRCSPQLEEAQAQQQRPSTANKVIHFLNCQTVFQSCWFIYVTNKCMSFNCSKYLTELTLVHPFNVSLSSGCEVVSHGGVDSYSLITGDVEHLFTCLLLIHVVLAKCCSNFCPIFFFFCPTFSSIFYFLIAAKIIFIFWIQVLHWLYFLPTCVLPLQLLKIAFES